MKFIFFASDCTTFHRHSLEERPLGGTETGIIHFSNALAELGHKVAIVSNISDQTEVNPSYILPEQIPYIEQQDVCISVRNWKGCFIPRQCKKYFFWTGDSFDNVHTIGIGDPRLYKFLDGLLCVSDWQSKILCFSSGFPQWKTWVLRNGVNLSNFEGSEKRERKRLIYTSQPSRGLEYLPMIFKSLKAIHSDLELHIYSGGNIYEDRWSPSAPLESNFKRLFDVLKSMKGCYVHGNIVQKDLAREYMKSAIWVYPTHFEETSCICAMEAQAAGCAIVTSALAALGETVGEAGFLLHQKPGTHEYLERFIELTNSLLSNDRLFAELSFKSLEQARKLSWNTRALSFLEYLKVSHDLN